MKQLPLPATIRKSNDLCRAKWSPHSVYEPRLVALVARDVRPGDEAFQTYKIPISEALQTDTDSIGGSDYKRCKDLADNIVGSTIRIEQKDGRSFATYGIFAKCQFLDGAFHIQFHPDLKDHYLNLKQRFTEYNSLEFMKLVTIYSQRLFEILKSWDDQPEIELEIKDLQERIAVPASLKKDFKDFRRRVLEPAHREISKKTSLAYEWEALRKGRKVVGIRFIFSKKRAAPVAKAKKAASDRKQSDRANKSYKDALACRAQFSKSGRCAEDKGEQCRICSTFLR